MASLDPSEYDIYQLLPPNGTRRPGKDYSGTILIHWMRIMDTQEDVADPKSQVAEFEYKGGKLIESTKNELCYLQHILKGLPLGSTLAIRPRGNTGFPGERSNERFTLIFSITRDSTLGMAEWDRLVLLDYIPGVGKFFVERMSRSNWNIAAESIPEEAEAWAELVKDNWRGFWYGFWEQYCRDVSEVKIIFVEYLRVCTRVESLDAFMC
ncbi:regulatory particle non-ATPase [Microsporum ferrugineum]